MKTLRQYLQCEWSDCGEAGCFRPERVKAGHGDFCVASGRPLPSDPLGRYGRWAAESLCSRIALAFVKRKPVPRRLPRASFSQAVPIHVPQQPNDFDCGIYAGGSCSG